MIKSRFPLQYELTPDTLEKGTQWLTLRLRNIADVALHNLDIKMHSTDSFHIYFHNSTDHVFRLPPNEERYLAFQVEANATTSIYISVRYYKEGGSFHWDSPWIHERVVGEVAELERVLVTNPYGLIGRELEVEAMIRGFGDSNGLDLIFWADTPSGEYEDIAQIKTKKLSNGEKASYTAKITPKEKGYYTVYSTLINNYKRIGRDSATIYVEK
jgi:hypothetical protein